MCGRFKQTGALAQLTEILGIVGDVATGIATHAPGTKISVIRGDKIETLRWGLTPRWAKKDALTSLINARAETIAEKPSFKDSFKSRRCVVPANGFFEWDRAQKPSQPYEIHFENDASFAIAALWDEWKNPGTGEVIESFALLTKAANETIAPIHDRMPVILRTPGAVKKWLAGDTPLPELHQLMAAESEGLMLTPVPLATRLPKGDLPEESPQGKLFGNLP